MMRSLKAFLATLILGAVLPGVGFGLGTSWWLAKEVTHTAEQDARAMAAQNAANVAEHIQLVTTALKALARSPALGRDDLEEAYQFALHLSADLGQHIGLAAADGQQLFNTRRPFGTALPRRADPTSYRRALETDRPSVSDVIIGALVKQPLITIDVPVATPNGPRVLGTSTDVATIGAVLARTPLRPGWEAAVVDGDGRLIARSPDPEQSIGKPATPEVIAAVKSRQPRGSFRDRSHEGQDLYSFYSKVPGTGWTVVVVTPEPVLFAPLRGSLAALAAAGGAAIGLTLTVAVVLGRRLDAAARRLTEHAEAMGRGRALPPPSQSIAEFEQVEAVLREAARMNSERQAELAHAREAAEQSVAAKNRFIAAASHDLRQPLHAAGWCIELLQQSPDQERAARYLDGLKQTHATLTTLIDNLFDIAKMDAEGIAPRMAPLSLSELIRRIVVECRPAAEEKHLDLRSHVGPEVRVITDGEMVARILRNLVHNAIRYTETGGVLLACRRRKDALWIEVWDTGIGIAPGHLELIWEEFYQIAQRDGRKGSGLGLSIVLRLAKLLGLRVEVRSVPGKGSVFRLVVPGAVVAAKHETAPLDT